MGFALPNGAQVYLASAYETALPFTAISNAAPAVLTVVGNNNIKKDDIVHLASDWTGLNERVARVSAATVTSITLEAIDTRQTDQFPAGGGIGQLRKIKTWTEIPQIKEVSSTGGEQQTVSLQFLSDTVQRHINTVKAPRTLTYTLGHDASLAVYPLLRAADQHQETVAMAMSVPLAKEKRYWSATLAFNEVPTTEANAVETVSLVLNMQSPAMTFYKEIT
ncbi:phage tail protein [Candidatus Regiella endosymbiont of Tuberolachnus salignus]|uniref:phage tail protein n=1 Tax=Candidatus Regiella endosymbiont of Tuberolachnus salignus TaxID=3077956 RepID=UPI0030D0FFB7